MNQSKKKARRVAVRIASLSPQYSEQQLGLVIDRLNSPIVRMPVDLRNGDGRYQWQDVDMMEIQTELRSLVSEWLLSGRDFSAVLKIDADLSQNCRDLRTMLLPDRDGNVQVAFSFSSHAERYTCQKQCAISLA